MLYFVPESSVLGEKAVIEAVCVVFYRHERRGDSISDEFNFEDVG